MRLQLTTDRDLAKKVTALAADVDDARVLLLALGIAAKAEDQEPQEAINVDSDHVPPAKRRTEWARTAGEMHAAVSSVAQIATMLAVDEDLAAELVGDWWAEVRR